MGRAEQVLQLLAQGERRAPDIAEALGLTATNAGVLLSRLTKRGCILRVARGVYALPGGAPDPPAEPTADGIEAALQLVRKLAGERGNSREPVHVELELAALHLERARDMEAEHA